jgi:hypothetical protein
VEFEPPAADLGPAPENEHVDTSAIGLGLALAGCAAMVVGVFLPAAESSDFGSIAHNTAIQNGDGWFFVVLALSTVGDVFRAYRARVRTWGPVIAGAIAVGAAVYLGTSNSELKLCSTDTPALGGSQCEIGHPGIGLYVAGVGGLLMLLGGWQIRIAKPSPGGSSVAAANEDRPTKTCPECAETVLEAARVCKHCGFRFAPPLTPESEPPEGSQR